MLKGQISPKMVLLLTILKRVPLRLPDRPGGYREELKISKIPAEL